MQCQRSGALHSVGVNDPSVGRAIRLLRYQHRWRQQDLAERAGVSQGSISLMERGRLEGASLRAIRAVLEPFGARAWLDVRWRDGLLDRLLDEHHASLTGTVSGVLSGWSWEVAPEVSYAVYGERGSIDLLAWHAASSTLLVVEVKSELVSIEATLRKHDEKVRLGPRIAAERFGWTPRAVAGLVVLPDERTQRRRVERHDVVLRRALPIRGRAVRAWLQRPSGSMAGLWFVTPTNDARAGSGPDTRRRVQASRPRTSEPATPMPEGPVSTGIRT